MSTKSQRIDRRKWIAGLGTAATLGVLADSGLPGGSPLFTQVAAAIEGDQASGNGGKKSTRHCIILWMPGGPSQMDTFDLKPQHANGGEFKEIATASPGLRFSEHLPQLAKMSEHLAVLRGLSTKEGDHLRATELMRTGHRPGGPVDYPAIGCSLAKVLANEDAQLPSYLTVSAGGGLPGAGSRPGFLGPKYAATPVLAVPPPDGQFANIRLNFLSPQEGLAEARQQTRLELLDFLQQDANQHRKAENIAAHATVYRRAIRMMQSDAKAAFDLSGEDNKTREAYGRGTFGQGCLLARRLIERDVPLVEVSLGNGLGWDTHTDNFNLVKTLSQQLDQGWSMLMRDLRDRGLLESTTILWAGEFGRTPAINSNGGRDHFPTAWSCVLSGGGIQGGGAYGKTSDDGMEVVDGKIDQQDVMTTLCRALQIEPDTEHFTPEGRPLAIAEGTAIESVLS